MNYSNLRGKLIPKYGEGNMILTPDQEKALALYMSQGMTREQALEQVKRDSFEGSEAEATQISEDNNNKKAQAHKDWLVKDYETRQEDHTLGAKVGAQFGKAAATAIGNLGGDTGAIGTTGVIQGIDAAMAGDAAGGAMGIVGGAVTQAVGIADNALMGDKNFSASSQAIDKGVHTVSGALMQSGNPYAMAAGVALEGLNFATKAGGRTVPGFDVDIEGSGYGTVGHMESSSGRVWDTWSGATARKLAKRNEQARMALNAADISSSQSFQQEARANSIQNVLEANRAALAGGVDTSLLGS